MLARHCRINSGLGDVPPLVPLRGQMSLKQALPADKIGRRRPTSGAKRLKSPISIGGTSRLGASQIAIDFVGSYPTMLN